MKRKLLTVALVGVALGLLAMLVMTTATEHAAAEARRQECDQVLAEANAFAVRTSTLGIVKDLDGNQSIGLVDRPYNSAAERAEAESLTARARAACRH